MCSARRAGVAKELAQMMQMCGTCNDAVGELEIFSFSTTTVSGLVPSYTGGVFILTFRAATPVGSATCLHLWDDPVPAGGDAVLEQVEAPVVTMLSVRRAISWKSTLQWCV